MNQPPQPNPPIVPNGLCRRHACAQCLKEMKDPYIQRMNNIEGITFLLVLPGLLIGICVGLNLLFRGGQINPGWNTPLLGGVFTLLGFGSSVYALVKGGLKHGQVEDEMNAALAAAKEGFEPAAPTAPGTIQAEA